MQLSKLHLRLDSHLFLLSKVEEVEVGEADSDPGLVLEEAYAIKKGPLVMNEVGRWSKLGGLTIPGMPTTRDRHRLQDPASQIKLYMHLPEPDIWTRRRDLRVRKF